MPIPERLRTTVRSAFAIALPVIIIGGISRHFPPTGPRSSFAVYAFIVGAFIYRELKWSAVYGLFLAAGKTTAVVMFLVAAAMVNAWLITVANIPTEVADMLSPFMGNKTLLMFVMMLLIVIVGTALDFAPTIADTDAGADAGGAQGRHRSGVFRRSVHHEQCDRPDYAARWHGTQRRLRCRENNDG